jgi:hypothetical protein
MARSTLDHSEEGQARGARLGFCVDAKTKGLVALSGADRTAFFEALVHPPKPNARLRRAARAEATRVER